MPENIIIDFVINEESLAPAIDRLEKLGLIDSKIASAFKQTNAEINKQATAVKNVATASVPLKKNLEDVSKAAKNTANQFMQGFQEGIIDTLKEAGVSLDQFEAAMEGTGGTVAASTQTVRAELRGLVETIARAKAEGLDYGESYDALVLKAGRLKDAIGDVNSEIQNVASDTSGFDGLVSLAAGAAGAFSAVQGAAALFGDESEELQEVLLRVNAAMAIAQGLQQVQTVLQKESAGARLVDIIAMKAQTVAHTVFNFVVGASTTALKVFRAALVTTGIGALIVAVGFLINKLMGLSDATDDATEKQNALNEALEQTNATLAASNDIYVEAISTRKKILQSELELVEARGGAELKQFQLRQQIAAEEKTIGQQSLANLGLTRVGVERLENQYASLAGQIAETREKSIALLTIDSSEGAKKVVQKQIDALEGQAKAIKPLLDAGKKALEQIDEGEKALAVNQAKRQKELADQAKEAAEKLRARRNEELQDVIAGIERQLLAVAEGSQQELDLRKELSIAKRNLDLNAENLTQNEIKLIQENSFKERADLQKAFNEKLRADAISAQISRNNAELSLLKTNNDDRLILQIANIELAAQVEIDAAVGNGAKIKELIAKRDQDIRDTKIKFIREAVDYEIALETARGGSTSRALERIASDEKAKKDLRISAVRELALIENDAIDKRLAALQSEYNQRLIGEQEYQLKYAQLQDQKVKVTRDAEGKITGIVLSEQDKREKRIQGIIQIITEAAQGVASVLDGLSNLQREKENERLELERNQLQAQREAGQLTEKEFLARTKRMEAEEKRVRYEQARRDKQLALFKAIINTALAVTNAITTGDPYTAALRAAIVAAIGLAEIAIINNRPLPRFAKGKKKGESYSGWGEVGETGAELIERDGKLYLAPRRTIIHIKSQDIIHSPRETKSIFEGATHRVDKQIMNYKETVKQAPFDIKGLAKEFGKNFKQTSVNIDANGFTLSVKDGLNTINYMNNRYKSP